MKLKFTDKIRLAITIIDLEIYMWIVTIVVKVLTFLTKKQDYKYKENN